MPPGNTPSGIGDPLPKIVEDCLKKELDSICGHGYAVLYVIAVKLVAYSNAGGYQVGSRARWAPSAVAHFPAFRRSTACRPTAAAPVQVHEFITDGSVDDGADLPDKDCPTAAPGCWWTATTSPLRPSLGLRRQGA